MLRSAFWNIEFQNAEAYYEYAHPNYFFMVIKVSSRFKKSYRKLPNRVKIEAKRKEKIFCKNPFDKKLDTHKLHRKYKDFHAFTVTRQWRIMFAFSGKDRADFIDIGIHEIYR